MLAVWAESFDSITPIKGLRVGSRPEPEPQEGWVEVTVRAASLNHHDLWTLRGVGLRAEQLPMVLGQDAAGIDQDGNAVIVHSVLASDGWTGDETLDPGRTTFSEYHPGLFSERITVPRANLVPKPAALSFEEAACLPTAWLTAFRMLFGRGVVVPGSTVLVQGAGGGVATAAIALGRAAGLRVWATSRSEEKRARAVAIGAHAAFEPGARLPERVDAVIETVGDATWSHSVKALKPGGKLIVAGATSGARPTIDLNHVFFRQLSVVGSTMGTRRELELLCDLLASTGLKPFVHETYALADAAAGFAAMEAGEVFGKIVFVP